MPTAASPPRSWRSPAEHGENTERERLPACRAELSGVLGAGNGEWSRWESNPRPLECHADTRREQGMRQANASKIFLRIAARRFASSYLPWAGVKLQIRYSRSRGGL